MAERRVIPSPKENRRTQARSVKLSVTSVSPPTRPMRNALGHKGTGQIGVPAGKIFDFSCGVSSGDPSLMGFGCANVKWRALLARHLTFLPRPRCPGVFPSHVIPEFCAPLMQRGQKRKIKIAGRDRKKIDTVRGRDGAAGERRIN